MTVEISDEDWDDPAFQTVWREMIEEEILKVVKIEREMPKRLLHGEKAQSAMEYLILTGAAIVGAAVIYAFKGAMTALNPTALIILLLYASTGLSLALIRGCDMDIRALKRQSKEIMLGVTELRGAADLE